MSNAITTGSVHHLTLTVNNVARSQEFYTRLLGFQVAMEIGPRLLLSNGSTILAITPPAPERTIRDDRFDENRIGLDHLSFGVGSRNELEQAVSLFDENEVSHGEIK